MIHLTRSTLTILFITSTFFQTSSFAQFDETGNRFRVMTYNIRYAGDEKTDGINAWNNRKRLVASMIKFNHADIVGLQEALLLQLDDLTELLPGYSWIGVGRDDGKNKGEFSAILFRDDRFEVLKQSTFWLSATPDNPSMGWDAAFPRVVTWAELKDKQTEKEFFIFNTHYDHIGEVARINSSKLLRKRITEICNNFRVILTGDFNTQASTEAYQILLSQSDDKVTLYDAQSESQTEHHGSHVTFNGFGTAIEPGNKIDFIFLTKETSVLQHGVIDETVDGHYPSDHMPVIAEVIIK